MPQELASISDDVGAYIERLKAKGTEFAQAFKVHEANRERVKDNPELYKQWASINNYAYKVRDTIQTINNSVDSGVNWVRDLFGLDGMPQSGVGALPLIPIAYVVGATTALTWVIGEIYKFNALVNRGIDPTKQGTTLGDTASLIKWGVIAVGVYFAWKKWGK